MSWGKIYDTTWWGNTGESNGWGNVYPVSSYDAATQALLDQATTDGYTAASGSVLTALDNLIIALKADGIWTKVDILYVMATNGDVDFATYNLKDPTTFKLTNNGATFTSLEGFTGDGVNDYLNTGWQPSVDASQFTQNAASFGVYQRTNTAGDLDVMMSSNQTVANRRTIYADWNRVSNPDYKYCTGSSATSSDSNVSNVGLNFINRANSTQIAVYTDGTLFETISSTSTSSFSAVDTTILASNNNGAISRHSVNQCSMAFIGGDLSAEASDFYNAIQAYMTSLGKQV